MSIIAVLVVCIQACLVPNVFGQCLGYGGISAPAMTGPVFASPLGIAAPGYSPLGYNAGCNGAYGGSGVGTLAVAGELPVAGNTIVAGQVPIIGAVEFSGTAPAAGAVTISGSCGCGCNAPYIY